MAPRGKGKKQQLGRMIAEQMLRSAFREAFNPDTPLNEAILAYERAREWRILAKTEDQPPRKSAPN